MDTGGRVSVAPNLWHIPRRQGQPMLGPFMPEDTP